MFPGRIIKLFLIISSLLLTACTEAPVPTFRTGSVLWPGYEPLYLASKLGYYDDQDIKIIDYLSNTDAMLAFRNNFLDAGAFTLDEALQLISHGADVEIILIMDVSHGGDVILANPQIQSMQDLKGKSVAVESSAVGAYVLARALEVHNLTPEDITVVSTNALEQVSAFSEGSIDAAVSFDPYRSQLLKMGKHEIFNSTEIPNEVIDTLVVRRESALKNPSAVTKLIEAWFKALEYQSSHPLESASYSVQRFDISEQQYIENLKLLKFSSRTENLLLLDPQKSPLLKQQHKLASILMKLKLINTIPSLEGHLNPNYIRQ